MNSSRPCPFPLLENPETRVAFEPSLPGDSPLSQAHATLGEYLAEHEPVQVVWHHLEGIVGGDETGRIPLEKLTLPAATIYLVGVFEGQLGKGGFRQFFADPSGDFTAETLQALREVGAHVSVELLEKVLGPFPGSTLPSSRDQRLNLLAQADAQEPTYYDNFDELYNSHVDVQSPHRVEKIDALLLDYMKEHAEVRLTN
jgi:hypothetical protein